MEAYQYDIYSQTINETHKEAEYEEFNGEYIIKNESRSSILSKIQFMSMYPTYPDFFISSFIFSKVVLNIGFGLDQYIKVPISPV